MHSIKYLRRPSHRVHYLRRPILGAKKHATVINRIFKLARYHARGGISPRRQDRRLTLRLAQLIDKVRLVLYIGSYL